MIDNQKINYQTAVAELNAAIKALCIHKKNEMLLSQQEKDLWQDIEDKVDSLLTIIVEAE